MALRAADQGDVAKDTAAPTSSAVNVAEIAPNVGDAVERYLEGLISPKSPA